MNLESRSKLQTNFSKICVDVSVIRYMMIELVNVMESRSLEKEES